MNYQWIWLALGVIFMIVEIITPGFWFFSFGLGAIVTGLLARFLPLPAQLAVFAVSTTISFLLMKKFAGALLKPNDSAKSNVFALIGKTGTITKTIQPHQKGYVKIEGEEWSAKSEKDDVTIEVGSLVKVLNLEGNKLIVELISKEN